MNKLSIFISRIRDAQDIYACVKRGFHSIDDLKLGSDSTVVIKPNLCCIKSHETGATTDPRVVEAIIRCLKNEFDVTSIHIVESDATQVLADMAFKLLGYERLARKLERVRIDVKLVNLSKSPLSVKVFPKNAFLKKIKIPKIMDNADFFISVPKIKTHGERLFTSTLKNQFGCNPDPHKSKVHKRLHDGIVDLNVAFKPDFVVVDGLVAMGGYRGPVNGVPIKMNTLIFGRDPVAMDHLVARIIGINPSSVRYLVEAERRGVGTTEYITMGTIPWEFKREFRINRPRLRNLYGLFRRNN